MVTDTMMMTAIIVLIALVLPLSFLFVYLSPGSLLTVLSVYSDSLFYLTIKDLPKVRRFPVKGSVMQTFWVFSTEV